MGLRQTTLVEGRIMKGSEIGITWPLHTCGNVISRTYIRKTLGHAPRYVVIDKLIPQCVSWSR